MKKLLTLVLTLMLLMVVIAVPAKAEKIKLTGMCWGSTGQYDSMTAEFFAAYPEMGEKYEIEWVLGGANGGEVAEKIRYGLSSNESVCDFAVLSYAQLPEFAGAGLLVDITDTVRAYEPTMPDSAVRLAKFGKEYVAVPFEVKTKVWFYRSDIFAECGINAEEVKTVDDFIAAGLKIQEKYPDSKMWNLGSNPGVYQYFLTLSGNGAKFYDDEGNYVIASDAGTRTMLEDYKKMYDAGIIADVSDWTPDWEAALADGTLVTQLSAGWLGQDIFLPTYSGPENEWKVTTWPVIGGTDAGSDGGGSVMVVPINASNPEAAADYIAAQCLSKEGTKTVFHANGSLPQHTENLADESLFNEQKEGYFGMSIVDAQIAAMDKYAIFDYSPNSTAEQNIVKEYFTKAITGEMTIDDALAAAENDLKTLIGNAFN